MTAIVGIINSRGVVVAADSAVTTTSSNTTKIFNTANKVFALSKTEPLGIAIYNDADFVNIPFETLIKDYRAKHADSAFDTIEDCRDSFIDYLQAVPCDAEVEKLQFYRFCYVILNTINPDKTNLDISVNNILVGLLPTINRFGQVGRYRMTMDYLNQNFDNTIDETLSILKQTVENDASSTLTINATLKDNFKNSVLAVLNSDVYLTYTGIVFFGFGKTQLLPSIATIKINGLFGGELRFINDSSIGDNGVINIQNPYEGWVVPFAQSDITNKIIHGISPTLQNFIIEKYKEGIQSLKTELSVHLGVDAPNVLPTETNAHKVSMLLDNKFLEFQQQIINEQREKHSNPLLQTVANLGKEDMADLAESLIKVTSLKRKISNVEETVGGPIDVAVITKGDGFIWIKRKHYFSPELNSHFFKK